MDFILQPWPLYFLILAGWVIRQQQIIEFQNSQIEALFKKLGKKCILLTDDRKPRTAKDRHVHEFYRNTTRRTWASNRCTRG